MSEKTQENLTYLAAILVSAAVTCSFIKLGNVVSNRFWKKHMILENKRINNLQKGAHYE